MEQTGNIIFKAESMRKYFGVTHANDDVSIEIPAGQIRGLIGENGSGKSTLISMIAGISRKDFGMMYLCGKPYEPESPLGARNRKIGTVVQELGLIDGLPVGMNLFLGAMEPFKRKNGILDTKKLFAEAQHQLRKWGFPGISARQSTEALSVENKKIVELVRALSINPELLILDEITQALSLNNRKKLIDIIIQLKREGKAVLIVTHDIEEMVAITDFITVMRDGRVVAERESEQTTTGEIKRLMVGRDINNVYNRESELSPVAEDTVLEVRNLCSDKFRNVSFDLHKGEIVGICGLSDSGIHELAESLFTVRKVKGGTITLPGKDAVLKTPKQAMDMGVGYVPKDRDHQALMVHDSIKHNIALAAVEMTKQAFGFLNPAKACRLSEDAINRFQIKTSGPDQTVSGLSGGNRQKVNLARWTIQNKDVLILDCPTRGVDIGVKAYIYRTMTVAKENGVSIILVSDELPEIIGMSDTVLVMKDGEIVKQIPRSSGFSEETIIEVMI
jgi:ribose transport system ATP-binding protein